jgi:mannose-6-phosphate isomerase-like protein (cupin superfamily)
MVKVIKSPSVIKAAGTGNKIIKEFFGHVNSGSSEVSIARMESPQGWEEPGQCPEFNEYTVVLKGSLIVRTHTEEFKIKEGEAILTSANEWVQYSTPYPGGAEYIAVCLPAFSPEIVHRDKI